MDYISNSHFFDKAFNEKTKKIFLPSAIACAVGGALVAVSFFGPYALRWVGNLVGWPILIAGVVFLLVALNRRVNENDVLSDVDNICAEVKALCNEKLDYPKDLDENGLLLTGCAITEENAGKAVKLKSGNYLDTDLLISFIYARKDALCTFCRKVSLVREEDNADIERVIPYTDFDTAKVETENVMGKIIVHYIRLYNGGEKVYEAPLQDNDYYKEEFCLKIAHFRERALK